MNKKMRRTLTSVAISAALMSSYAYPVLAADAPEPSATAETVSSSAVAAYYTLTDTLDVQVKSVVNEHVLDGTRLGIVVKVRNNGGKITRVPEYELRVTTSDGVTYTLQPSASNPKSIQPKADTELSYMSVIDRTDDFTLSEVNYTDVDYYVYPKTETLVVAVPVSEQSWKGSDMAITNPAAVKKWSDSFTIPYSNSPIQFTPVGITKELRDQGAVYVVQVLAKNDSDKRETAPDFLVDGKTEAKVFAGERVEKDAVVLEAGEQKYIHYAIPTDQDTVLASLNVLTTEKFVQAGAAASTVLQYKVGRLNILLPNQASGVASAPYTLGETMTFDANSQLIHPDLKVSVVEFNMNDNAEEGNKTVTAKFLLKNGSDRPMNVPVFQTSLISSDGYQYDGNRQAATAATVLPNSGLTVNYAFTLPVSETGENLTLKVEDAVIAAPYKTPIAAYAVQLQKNKSTDTFSVYPFDIKLNSWSVSLAFNGQAYSYKGKLYLDIQRKNDVQIDSNSPAILLEVYDDGGRMVATIEKSLLGQNRLATGENLLNFTGTSDQFDPTVKLKIYEVFKTKNGQSKRLLADLTQK
ncbi:hypothetical protein ACFQI7_09295 [Paenibacillus allorhizosphaerae]|uniref:Copper amine oxidase N-terminal domain-containing protein n=1 Tax=Paenibacillus allorhizosphaerae TaxID=2849866 RepID=A0ABM8VIG5_9BACL|nr:hypothetical protein [Paenibacillus allorhizosphaerae]CAG7644165.1 hypothetical protein PAECIP111802_03170 [Paenibacillus allorhizosphaerae]